VAHEQVALDSIHTEYPVRVEGKEVDIVLGNPLKTEAEREVPLLVEIQFWKGRLDYYLSNYKGSHTENLFFDDDIEKLIKFRSIGNGVAIAFFQKLPPSPHYKAKSEEETLQNWKELESIMVELEKKLRNNQIRLLFGPRLEFYEKD
jgi:hypothetical protein